MKHHLDSLKKKAKRLGKNVIFTGKVPWNEVPVYYNLANVFSTASHTETQGLTVIEAMASSLAVVALNDESFNTVIKDDYDGYLFNDKKQYRSKIENLMKDREKCLLIGKNAYQTALKYSNENYAKSVIKVYELALKGRNINVKRSFFKRAYDVVKRGLHDK